MIAPDANLLIYSYNPAAPEHTRSRAWLEDIFSGTEIVGIPIMSVYAFLRFITHQNHLKRPASFAEAVGIVNSWLALPHVRILYPGDQHWKNLLHVSQSVRVHGAQVTDATIAAIALEYNATVHTNDNDFRRFSNVRCFYPLQA
jgi:toxin-antitoxin system PIN domain toxin